MWTLRGASFWYLCYYAALWWLKKKIGGYNCRLFCSRYRWWSYQLMWRNSDNMTLFADRMSHHSRKHRQQQKPHCLVSSMHTAAHTHMCEHTHTPYQYSISTYNNITITKPTFGFPPLIFTHYILHYRSSLSRTSTWCQLLLSLPHCLAQWNRCSPQIDRRLPAVFQTRANKEAANKSSFTAGQDQPAFLLHLMWLLLNNTEQIKCLSVANKTMQTSSWKDIKEDGGVV